MEIDQSSFRKLLVWQKSMEVASMTYRVTNRLPKEEMYGLVSQMRRCAVSIPSNIAEGSKRKGGKDFIKFLRVAAGSAAELETQLLLTDDLYSMNVMEEVYPTLNEVQKMIQAFIKKL